MRSVACKCFARDTTFKLMEPLEADPDKLLYQGIFLAICPRALTRGIGVPVPRFPFYGLWCGLPWAPGGGRGHGTGWGCARWRGKWRVRATGQPRSECEGGRRLRTKQEEGQCPSPYLGPDAVALLLRPPLGPAFGHLQNGFFGVVKWSFPAYFLPWKAIHAQDKHIDFKKSGESWSGREDLNLRPPEPHSGAIDFSGFSYLEIILDNPCKISILSL